MHGPQKTPFSVMGVTCIDSNTTLPSLGFFFPFHFSPNLKSFNLFTNIYPASLCLMRIILWDIKTHTHTETCLLLPVGRATTGHEEPSWGRIQGAPFGAAPLSLPRHSVTVWSYQVQMENTKMCWRTRQAPQRRMQSIAGRKKMPADSCQGCFSATFISSDKLKLCSLPSFPPILPLPFLHSCLLTPGCRLIEQYPLGMVIVTAKFPLSRNGQVKRELKI